MVKGDEFILFNNLDKGDNHACDSWSKLFESVNWFKRDAQK